MFLLVERQREGEWKVQTREGRRVSSPSVPSVTLDAAVGVDETLNRERT